MLEALKGIVNIINSLVNMVINFFRIVEKSMVMVYQFAAFLPGWLYMLMVGVIAILAIKLLLGRN